MKPIDEKSSPLRILVIGADTLCREGLCRLLDELPCQVECRKADTVEDVQGPLANGAFDLIFLGVIPLGSDYGATVRAVKEKAGNTPIAALALVDTPSAVRGTIAAGASGFIPTMASPKVILHAVELMLSGGVYLPPSVLGSASGPARQQEAPEAGQIRLTRRQEAVLRELAKGQSNKQIAGALGLSEATVKVHIAAIMKTLKAQNRTHAVLTATQAGILPEPAV